MFRKSLGAMGRRQRAGLGGRQILVPPKISYPLQSGMRLGSPLGRTSPTAAERRRRNLTYLASFIIVTFLLGLLPAMRFLLVVNLIADVLLVLYLGLALYLAVWPPVSEAQGPRPEPEFTPQRAVGS